MKVVYGERIGKTARLSVSCSAVIFDEDRQKLLLMRRDDNGRWSLPGGHMDAGESVTEACAREVLEETGLHVQVGKLIGVYSSPDMILQYADGNRYQTVHFCFEARPLAGTLTSGTETLELAYFSREELAHLDIMEHHLQRIEDAWAGNLLPFMR